MKKLPILLGFLAVALPALAADLASTVTAVHDGDTITLGDGTKIRVFGIDAPELAQQCKTAAGTCEPCGHVSRAALAGLVLGKPLTCAERGVSYNRIVGECSVNGVAIGPWMLREGQAVAYERYLKVGDRPGYMGAQDEARTARRGIWAETFIPPADWRHHRERLECER